MYRYSHDDKLIPIYEWFEYFNNWTNDEKKSKTPIRQKQIYRKIRSFSGTNLRPLGNSYEKNISEVLNNET